MTIHNGRANTGPTSLSYLLNRRNVSFARWCEQEGINTQEQFENLASKIEKAGEFFISPEMLQMAVDLLPKDDDKEVQVLPAPILPFLSVEENFPEDKLESEPSSEVAKEQEEVGEQLVKKAPASPRKPKAVS